MGTLNRVVNVAVLVVAIVAVVFGTMLFKKRDELRGRGDKMAAMISAVAAILDVNSETKYKDALVATKLELDPAVDPKSAESNKKKSLYHNNFANLDTILNPFKKQSQDLAMQRDALGTTLKGVADELEIPETFMPGQFQSIETYEATNSKLIGYVTKVNERDDALVQQIASSAKVIGQDLDAGKLKNLDEYAALLGEFGTKVEALKQRSDAYGEHIARVCQILDVPAGSLEGDTYPEALGNIATAVQAVKTEFESTKTELEATKTMLAETQDKLRLSEEKYAKLNTKYLKVQKELDAILNPEGEGGAVADGGGQAQFIKKLTGTVIEINRKWDFVVIDIAEKTPMDIPNARGEAKKIDVKLTTRLIATASRDDNYLGKLRIIRVNPTCAIADILPSNRKGEIQVGDHVFFDEDLYSEINAPAAEQVN